MRTQSLSGIKQNPVVPNRISPLPLNPYSRIFCAGPCAASAINSLRLKILPVTSLFPRFSKPAHPSRKRNANFMNNLQEVNEKRAQPAWSAKSIFCNILDVNRLFSRFCERKAQSNPRKYHEIKILRNLAKNGVRSAVQGLFSPSSSPARSSSHYEFVCTFKRLMHSQSAPSHPPILPDKIDCSVDPLCL